MPTPAPDHHHHHHAAAVLTGGSSTRFGTDKALVALGDDALAQRVAAALSLAGADPVVAVGGDGPALSAQGLDWIADRWPGEGPLGGVVTALGHLGAPVVVVAACDLAWLEAALVIELVEQAHSTGQVAVPVRNGRHQWHLAAIPRARAATLEAAFHRGVRAMGEGLGSADLVEVDIDARWTRSTDDIDTPEDLARARRTNLGPSSGSIQGAQVAIPQIDVEELESRLADGGVVVLDVRTPDEYEDGHIAGAVLIPLQELPDRVGDVPSGAPLLIICQGGGRSQRACEFLADEGHDTANVAGGTGAWVASGRPVVAGPEPG